MCSKGDVGPAKSASKEAELTLHGLFVSCLRLLSRSSSFLLPYFASAAHSAMVCCG